MGMAVGDAFGDIVNDMSYADILENYGPYGIMGYDPNSHGPQITAYTQVAAYTINAVLVGSADAPGRIAGAIRDGFEKAWVFETE